MINVIEFKSAVETVLPTNHVFVADVSGSMYSALPKIRKHLKDNLAMLVKPKDTVSILYFASRGQYGSVFVGKEIASLKDLTDINTAIDRYLRPTGCTGFVEPLKLACDVASDMMKQNGNLNNLIFMTDGYDNCWSESDILKVCNQLPTVYQNITFLEYGWYCNRPLLEKMAEATNALHTFTESYEQYEPMFEQAISQQVAKRIEINVPDANHVVYSDGRKLHVVNVVNGIALIPENVSKVWSLNDVEKVNPNADIETKYVALFYAVHRMNPDLAWDVLKVLGDVYLAKKYTNCFTKQDYSAMKDAVELCVFDVESRLKDGYDLKVVPDENAMTLIGVLNILMKGGAELDLNSPDFKYSRTGRKAVQKADTTISDLGAQMAEATSSQERVELATKMIDHVEWTPEFVSAQSTVPLNKLVFNGNRANVSVQTEMKGSIPIPTPICDKFGLPPVIDSKIYRNYTIVRDGIVNMKSLPVFVSKAAVVELKDAGISVDTYRGACAGDMAHVLVNLENVPLVNRAMAKNVDGAKFCTNHIKLQYLKARQKVLKAMREALVGKVNAVQLAGLYGDEAAAFLSEQGIRDYGFSPKSTREESTDVYMSRELNVKIKGMSSIPAVSAVQKKIDGGKKLNVADIAMKTAMDDIAVQIQDMIPDEAIAWIANETKKAIDDVRELEKLVSVLMYAIVVAKRWFTDIDFENPVLDVEYNGVMHSVTVELAEKEVKI